MNKAQILRGNKRGGELGTVALKDKGERKKARRMARKKSISGTKRWHHVRTMKNRCLVFTRKMFRARLHSSCVRDGDTETNMTWCLVLWGTSAEISPCFRALPLSSPWSLSLRISDGVGRESRARSGWGGRSCSHDSWEPGLPLPMSVQPPFSFQSLSLFSLGLPFPTGSLGLVSPGAVSCSAKIRRVTQAQASQAFFRAWIPKENNWEQDVVRTDSSWQQLHAETATPPFWIFGTVLAPFLSEAEPCTFFFHSYFSSTFWAC